MRIKTSYEWINSRIETFIRIILDIFLFSLLVMIIKINISLINYLVLIFFLVNINYIFGKYHDFKINKNFYFIKYLIIDFFLIILNFLSFLLLNKIFINQIESNYLTEYIYALSVVIVFNSILRYRQLRYKIKTKKKSNWIFYGREEIYKILKIEIYNDSRFNDLINANDLNETHELRYYDGIIFDYNIKESFWKNNYQFSNKITLRIDQWIEKYYQKLPTKIINKNDIFIILNNTLDKKIQFRFKRLLDCMLSIFLLITTSPFILISSIIIFLQDYQSPFYKQSRTGLNCKPFDIYKLRTMKYDAEASGIQWSRGDDPRVTFIGNFLRKLRIDELPQLISVIKGDMALIGPRPERPEIDKKLKNEIQNYNIRYSIKPGLSGWAQVNFPYGASVKDSETKLSYDIFYIKNFSLLLDLLIFFKTIKLVLNAKGSTPI